MAYLLQGINGLLFLLGMLGNFLTVFVVLKKTHMQTCTNKLILSLAVSDCLYLSCIPFNIITSVTNEWIFGTAVCKLYYAIHCISIFSGSLTFTLLSVDRFIAVSYPFSVSKHRFSLFIIFFIVLAWVLAILASSPVMVYSNATRIDNSLEFMMTPFNHIQDQIFFEAEPPNIEATAYEDLEHQQRPFEEYHFQQNEFYYIDDMNLTDLEKYSEMEFLLHNNDSNFMQYLHEQPSYSSFVTSNLDDKHLHTYYDHLLTKLTNFSLLLPVFNNFSYELVNNIELKPLICSVVFPESHDNSIRQTYVIYSIVFGFLIPIITITVFYSLLISKISEKNRSKKLNHEKLLKKKPNVDKLRRKALIVSESNVLC